MIDSEPKKYPMPKDIKQQISHKFIFIFSIFLVSLYLFLFINFTEFYSLWCYGLYAIASHLVLTIFLHEIYLFYIANFYEPFVVAIMGSMGCVVAGILDHYVLHFIINNSWVREKYSKNRYSHFVSSFFEKTPFFLLFISSLLPIPFLPCKLVSIISGYPIFKYSIAVFLGRFPRFYFLAWLGYTIPIPDNFLLGIIILFVFIGFLGIIRKSKNY